MPIYKFIFEISFPRHYTGDALIDSTFHGGNTVQNDHCKHRKSTQKKHLFSYQFPDTSPSYHNS